MFKKNLLVLLVSFGLILQSVSGMQDDDFDPELALFSKEKTIEGWLASIHDEHGESEKTLDDLVIIKSSVSYRNDLYPKYEAEREYEAERVKSILTMILVSTCLSNSVEKMNAFANNPSCLWNFYNDIFLTKRSGLSKIDCVELKKIFKQILVNSKEYFSQFKGSWSVIFSYFREEFPDLIEIFGEAPIPSKQASKQTNKQLKPEDLFIPTVEMRRNAQEKIETFITSIVELIQNRLPVHKDGKTCFLIGESHGNTPTAAAEAILIILAQRLYGLTFSAFEKCQADMFLLNGVYPSMQIPVFKHMPDYCRKKDVFLFQLCNLLNIETIGIDQKLNSQGKRMSMNERDSIMKSKILPIKKNILCLLGASHLTLLNEDEIEMNNKLIKIILFYETQKNTREALKKDNEYLQNEIENIITKEDNVDLRVEILSKEIETDQIIPIDLNKIKQELIVSITNDKGYLDAKYLLDFLNPILERVFQRGQVYGNRMKYR